MIRTTLSAAKDALAGVALIGSTFAIISCSLGQLRRVTGCKFTCLIYGAMKQKINLYVLQPHTRGLAA